MTNFQLEDFTARGGKLLDATRKIFSEYADLKLKFLPLPETMKPSDGAIKLVFVGQYSAGKSSIIKMLSGIDTEIGADITTQKAHAYTWGDLEIVDTPGIHTELRPDHDEKSYYEINHAALLVFVVTNEGFDDRMGNHFRKLAVEQDRGKNMVLVVNKMDRTADGNSSTQQEIIAKDLQKVITPFTKEDLFLSFTDTESYFAWQEETDAELKDLLLEQSGFEKFVANLNSFVASRGVLSKIQTPLETLKNAITNVIGESEKYGIDRDIEAAEELLSRRQKALKDGKRKINAEIIELVDTLRSKIKTEGSNAASEIVEGITEDEAKRKVEAAKNQVDNDIADYEKKICDRLVSVCEEIDQEISLINKSAFAESVQINLDAKTSVSEENKLPAVVGDGGFIGNIAFNTRDAAKTTILGANAPELIKDIGHFFNYKFVPWEAVKFAKYLGWVAMAASIFMTIRDWLNADEERKKIEENLRKARRQIQGNFDDIAEKVCTQIKEAAQRKMNELLAPQIKNADDKLAEFKSQKVRLQALGNSLSNILGEVNRLMSEVQQTAKA